MCSRRLSALPVAPDQAGHPHPSPRGQGGVQRKRMRGGTCSMQPLGRPSAHTPVVGFSDTADPRAHTSHFLLDHGLLVPFCTPPPTL